MRTRQKLNTRLGIEELESRVVLTSIVPSLFQLHHSHVAAAKATLSTTSTNWSGYAAETNMFSPQGGAVSAVSANWTVPAVTGGGTAYSSMWVGIDGYSSPTVEQIGTDSDLVNGVPTYYAWYEMYPSYSVTISSVAVHVGDQVNASVNYSAHQ